MQRLRTVTSLDVSAVAGHHAMPAALLFGNPFINVEVMVRTDGRTHAQRTHIHQTEIVTNKSLSPQAGSTKKARKNKKTINMRE